MKRIDLNRNWTFQRGEPSSIPMMPAETKTVDLPHDFLIGLDVKHDAANGVNGGFYPGDTASYTKYIEIPEHWRGNRVLAHFDGCFGLAKIVVNGHMAGRHHYGYTAFSVDVTPFLNFGEKNRLTVTAGTELGPNARWYTGGGLYRDVELLTAPRIHIAVNGIFAHLDHRVDGDAFVTVETTVENHTDRDAVRWVKLTAVCESGMAPGAEGKICVFVPADETAVCRTTLCFENAAVWDIDHPELYTIRAELMDKIDVLDSAETIFGVREVTVDAKNGLRLNGRRVDLRGGCVHHDNGILGAASFYDSEFRKVKAHKQNGFNALRFSHNPPSSAMLEACDRLGMLVIDEAFDTWNMQKNYYDFSQFFENEWETELESFIKRDRNHPSVITWSIGNELPEQGGLSDGYRISSKLTQKVRELDSTRPVCGALCCFFNGLDDEKNAKFWEDVRQTLAKGGSTVNLDGPYGQSVWDELTEPFCAPWDIVGYNYLPYHYEKTGVLHPNRVIIATESKPRDFADYWAAVERYPYLIGDFEWTSHDYIGEAGIGKALYVDPENAAKEARMLNYARYPWRTANCGDFDLCGFEKPQLAFKRVVWGSEETYIAVKEPRHKGKTELLDRYAWPDVVHSWSWPVDPGTPVEVQVYTAADEVELRLNGKSLGREKARFIAKFTVPYELGTLEAVSFTDGQEIGRDILLSGGKPFGLKLTSDRSQLRSDGKSLCFVKIEAVDENGIPLPYVEELVCAEVTGTAVLVSLGTGRGCTEENFTSGKITLYKGTALAVLRSGEASGTAKLNLTAETLAEAALEICVDLSH